MGKAQVRTIEKKNHKPVDAAEISREKLYNSIGFIRKTCANLTCQKGKGNRSLTNDQLARKLMDPPLEKIGLSC